MTVSSPGLEALQGLARALGESASFRAKRDIGAIAACIDPAPEAVHRWQECGEYIPLGDDTAAIRDGAGYLLLAAEGILPEFLDRDPWFAGYSAVMVNVNDVAAMGGWPLAVVDVYFHGSEALTDGVLAGMRAACEAYGAPLVGGHTTRKPAGPHALAVAILGRADRLLPSSGAIDGDAILYAVDLRGRYRSEFPFFDAAVGRDAKTLRRELAVFAELATTEKVHACKDVSNAGLVGTLLMLLESSGLGAVLELERIPRPAGVEQLRWLLSFPSFGFLLTVDPQQTESVCGAFKARGLACAVIGRVQKQRTLSLAAGDAVLSFWDLSQRSFTGFGPFSTP